MSKKLPPTPPPKPNKPTAQPQPAPEPQPVQQDDKVERATSQGSVKSAQPSRSNPTAGWASAGSSKEKPATSPRTNATTPRQGAKPVPVVTSRVPQWSTKAPAKVSAEHCKVVGVKDLLDSQNGTFLISLRDQYDADWKEDAVVEAYVKNTASGKSITIDVKNLGDCYSATFKALDPGSYIIEVFVEAEAAKGSPYSLKCYEDDATISEGGTGFPTDIKMAEFHVAEGKQGAFSGDDKDERNEWTKLADRAQSQKGEIANKVIKQHTRLIRISGKGKSITMSAVPVVGDSLCNNEVFILDTGPNVYQWDGETAGIFLKNKANWYLKMLKDERQGKFKTTILQHDDNDAGFWEILGGRPDSIRDVDDSEGWTPILYRVYATKKGRLHFKEVASGVGQVLPSHLKTKGVFIYDLGFEVSLWEGKLAFKGLRELAAQRALDQFKHQFNKPDVLGTRVKEGGLNPVFNAFIGGM